ncbi:MAG TPA: cation transporter, partial [Steroidobacteraceae bacterium]|nr:cation transporter [Steroidobacteraceae bacterium]
MGEEGHVLRARVTGMDCGSCALSIEDGLRKLPGVSSVRVDFTTETLEVEGRFERARVEQRLHQLGYGLSESRQTGKLVFKTAAPLGFLQFLRAQPQQRIAVAAGLCATLAAATAALAPSAASGMLLSWVLTAVVILVGAPIFSKGLRALLFSRRITIDLLMTLAALGALLIGEAGEAATVVLLFTLGEGLEGFSASRARDSLRSLMALQPQTATLLQRHAQPHEVHEHEHDHEHGHDREHDHGPDHDGDHVHTR